MSSVPGNFWGFFEGRADGGGEMAGGIGGGDLERLAGAGGDHEMERGAVGDGVAGIGMFEAAFEGGVVGFPDQARRG